MRTVFPNRRAVFLIALCGGAVFLLTLLHLSQTGPSGYIQTVGRDVEFRRKVEAEVVQPARVESLDVPAVKPNSENKDFEDTNDDDIKEHKENPELFENKDQDAEAKQDKDGDLNGEKDNGNDKVGVVEQPPEPKHKDLENANRREFIKNMTRHAWTGYRKYAWGKNEVKPMAHLSHNQPIFGGEDMGATIVDGADTLFIMGLHEEFEQATAFIKDNFTMDSASTVSVFETTIRFTAFNTRSGIAKSLVNVRTKQASNYGWVMSSSSILSEFASLHLEYLYLSQLTGNDTYKQKVQRIRDVLEKANKKDGLYANYISPETGEFVGDHVSIGALGDSFYEYLIKSYVQTEHQDLQAYSMYRNVSEAIQQKMVFKSTSGLRYVAELRRKRVEHKMSHLSCFCPGMFALEADVEKDVDRKRRVMQLAEDLAHTCHESYRKSETGIGPEMFYFNGEHGENEDATSRNGENGYILRPEAIEGWFYLWRLTNNEKYRQWVWDAVLAIEKYCRKPDGYVGLKNVYKPEAGVDDVQQSFMIAETLKYAYLTFADDQIPLNKWVFNTEAHPFPIGFENMKRKVPAQ